MFPFDDVIMKKSEVNSIHVFHGTHRIYSAISAVNNRGVGVTKIISFNLSIKIFSILQKYLPESLSYLVKLIK